MNLELPPDARVQIFIAPGSVFPFAEGPTISATPPHAQVHRSPRRVLKGTAILALVTVAFVAGGRLTRYDAGLDARALAHPYPIPSASRSPASTAAGALQGSADVPPAFSDQLHQPATVTPAPGATGSGSTPKNAFGLED